MDLVNKFWGDLISYTPSIPTEYKPYEKLDKGYIPTRVTSPVVNDFLNNLPSTVIDSLEFNSSIISVRLEEMEDYIHSIIGGFNPSDIDKLCSENNNINGDSIFEAYRFVSDIKKNLVALDGTLSKYFFGNIRKDDFKEYESNVVRQVLELESEATQVNYAAMMIDNIVASVVKAYSDISLESANTIELNLKFKSDVGEYYDKSLSTHLKEEFNDLKFDKDSNVENLKLSEVSIQETLNKVLNNKELFLDLINKEDSIGSGTNSSFDEFIRKKRDSYDEIALNSAKDLIKSVVANVLRKEEFISKFERLEELKQMNNKLCK